MLLVERNDTYPKVTNVLHISTNLNSQKYITNQTAF
jgi:hypothetical protein